MLNDLNQWISETGRTKIRASTELLLILSQIESERKRLLLQITQNEITSSAADSLLIEMLQEEEQQIKDLAMKRLRDRYQQRMRDYAAQKLPPDDVDDVIQETWITFFNAVRSQKIVRVQPLLWGIITHKCADAVRKLVMQRSSDNDILLPGTVNKTDPAIKASVSAEEYVLKQEQLEFLRHIPHIKGLLSPRQQQVWILQYEQGYPPGEIAQLMGKHINTIHTLSSDARKRVKNFVKSDEFSLWLRSQNLKEAADQILN